MSKEKYPVDIHKTTNCQTLARVDNIIRWATKVLHVARDLGQTIGLRIHCPADDVTEDCPQGETLTALRLRLKGLLGKDRSKAAALFLPVEDNVVPEGNKTRAVKTLRFMITDAGYLSELTLPKRKKPALGATAKPATAKVS